MHLFNVRINSGEAVPPPYSPSVALPIHAIPMTQPAKVGFFRRHIRLFRALPAGLAALLWTSMMIYFLAYFMSLPANTDGSWPRIGVSYAAFPYISCIGAVLQTQFEVFCLIMGVLLWVAYWIDFLVGRRAKVANGLRMAKLTLVCISTIFLVVLAFANVNRDHEKHLITAAVQMLTMGGAKVCDWFLIRAMSRRSPYNPYLEKSRYWKGIATTIAIPTSIMTIIGIFGCRATIENGRIVFSTTCWSLESFAAPCEWVLCLCWMVALCTVAYDTYYLDYTVELVLSTPEPPKSKGNGLAFWRRWTRNGLEKEDPANEKQEYAGKQNFDGEDDIEEQEARRIAEFVKMFPPRRQTL